MDLNPDSLERLVPDQLSAEDTTGQEALRIGLERYAFACRHCRPGRLLDIACGVGYGTSLLSERVPQIDSALGLDLSEGAIAYARDHYADPRTRFLATDAMKFSDPDGFDTIVSIETIEHLPDPERFVSRLTHLIRPGGRIVASVPITPSVDANPHHLHDFTARSFRRLFAGHGFEELDNLIQDQPFRLTAEVTRSEARMETMRTNQPAYYLRHPGSLVRRIASTVRHRFKNRYLTIALQAPA